MSCCYRFVTKNKVNRKCKTSVHEKFSGQHKRHFSRSIQNDVRRYFQNYTRVFNQKVRSIRPKILSPCQIIYVPVEIANRRKECFSALNYAPGAGQIRSDRLFCESFTFFYFCFFPRYVSTAEVEFCTRPERADGPSRAKCMDTPSD